MAQPASLAALDTNGTLSQHQVIAMYCFNVGGGFPKVGCGNGPCLMENDLEIPSGEEKPATNAL